MRRRATVPLHKTLHRAAEAGRPRTAFDDLRGRSIAVAELFDGIGIAGGGGASAVAAEMRGSDGRSVLRGLVAAWLGLALLCGMASGRFVVEKNSLMVTSPNELRGKHDSAIANFGIPQYGGSMAGAIVYPKQNTDGCEEFSVSFRAKIGALPNFVVVDRGGDGVLPCLIWLSQLFPTTDRPCT